MNIFVLDKYPRTAARYHCDKHVCKMIVETAQMLSTVLQNRGAEHDRFYKPTHPHHPCVKWIDSHQGAFSWTLLLYVSLLREYNLRYEKVHATATRLPPNFFIDQIRSEDLESIDYYFTKISIDENVTNQIPPPPRCMPDDCKCETISGWNGAVGAYRWYYIQHKKHFARWKNGEKPEWFK